MEIDSKPLNGSYKEYSRYSDSYTYSVFKDGRLNDIEYSETVDGKIRFVNQYKIGVRINLMEKYGHNFQLNFIFV